MLRRRDLVAALGATAVAGCAGGGVTPGRSAGLSLPEQVASRPGARRGVRDGAADGGLDRMFIALAALDDHAASAPVSIVQVGDSHSAGDFFSARMRDLLQARFGAAGRGLLPPGRADRYYDPKLVSVSDSGWQRETSRSGAGLVPFGIAGVTQSSAGPARMTLTSDEAAGFDRVTVVFRRRPGGGSFAVAVDGGRPRVVATAGAAETVRADFRTGGGSRALTVESQADGEVDLLGWGTHRQTPGVLYQNFGIIGAQVDVLGLCDPQSVATELHDAALLVVAFGTNEAFGPAVDLSDYRDRFARCVGGLADAVPRASILAVGPPDVNRRVATAGGDALPCGAASPDALLLAPSGAAVFDVVRLAGLHARPAGHAGSGSRHGVSSGSGPAQGGRHADRPQVRSSSAAGRHGHGPARRLAGGGHGGGHAGGYSGFGGWARPAQLDIVCAAQREVAARAGWGYWDWSAAMGGPCSMAGWVDQRLGRADHVHMSPDGYAHSAELLFADLMGRYDAWRDAAKLTARSGPG